MATKRKKFVERTGHGEKKRKPAAPFVVETLLDFRASQMFIAHNDGSGVTLRIYLKRKTCGGIIDLGLLPRHLGVLHDVVKQLEEIKRTESS